MITSFKKQEDYSYSTICYDAVYEYKANKTATNVIYCDVILFGKDQIGVRTEVLTINRVDYFVHASFKRSDSGWIVDSPTHMWRNGLYHNAKQDYVKLAENILLGLVVEIANNYQSALDDAELNSTKVALKEAQENMDKAEAHYKKMQQNLTEARDRYYAAQSVLADDLIAKQSSRNTKIQQDK